MKEYTNENYPSFGKKYNGEKGVISLTSWKARIKTVSKTIFSLIKQCPDFHIVLVLSEQEFPGMCEELPDDLMLFVNSNLIEILWVYNNYKSFKKVLFTMDKYSDVPIISADDDCIYTCNYAQLLYNEWEKRKDTRISLQCSQRFNLTLLGGCSVINPPNCFKDFDLSLLDKMRKYNEDDMLYSILSSKFKIKQKSLGVKINKFIVFSNEIKPLNKTRRYDNKSDYYPIKRIIYAEFNRK